MPATPPVPRSAAPAGAAGPLSGCTLVSLRPVGGHAALRRAAASAGARLVALSPWRLVAREGPAAHDALRGALAAEACIFTSPAAVRAAAALQDPAGAQGPCIALGAATARALRRAGAREVVAPVRMDSEGVLALPPLAGVRGRAIGLVTAPGGRGRLAEVLASRGARVLRADVYARVPTAPSPRAIATLREDAAAPWVVLSSAGALDAVLAALPGDVAGRLRRGSVVASSARLAEHARANGFGRVVVAASPRPRDLVAAAAAAHPLA